MWKSRQRRERDPHATSRQVWRHVRAAADLLCTVVVVPWLLVWPFVVLWIITLSAQAGVAIAHATMLGGSEALATIYCIGASAHSALCLLGRMRRETLRHPLRALEARRRAWLP